MTRRPKGVREQSAGWLINQISRRMNDEMENRLKVHGLNLRLFSNLMTLLFEDELTQVELGKRVSEQKYATSRAVDSLEKLGLVQRLADPNSRRAHKIAITSEGRKLTKKLSVVINQVNESVLKDLEQDEQKELGRLLRKVLQVETGIQ